MGDQAVKRETERPLVLIQTRPGTQGSTATARALGKR